MKLKLHLHITDPMKFARGNYDYALHMYEDIHQVDGWIYVGEAELDIQVSNETVVRKVLQGLARQEEATREEFQNKLDLLERTRQEFLALTGPSEPKPEGNGTG